MKVKVLCGQGYVTMLLLFLPTPDRHGRVAEAVVLVDSAVAQSWSHYS